MQYRPQATPLRPFVSTSALNRAHAKLQKSALFASSRDVPTTELHLVEINICTVASLEPKIINNQTAVVYHSILFLYTQHTILKFQQQCRKHF